ncbi:MAG: ATP-binding cassette domain-containing protein, partial [Bacteroidia bacterium]|nr:ATP-binding cassette domain-containing protein [Bacteroidia bacterium]
TVAVVGPSGGGKSTLVDLIPRFYDPFEGEILLDGVDIKTIKTASLRRLIGYVTQEGVLFHDTIRNNIAYGVEKATDEAVIQAAKVAHADRFIDLFPEKYNTVTGERGTMLSGGQRQRIAIARAVFRNPPVLILDEATSSLDTESEQVVQQALDEIMQSRTAVVIAHRLSTILKADKIVVIDKGRIVQEGTHSDLIQKGGLYKKLYEMQFQDEK